MPFQLHGLIVCSFGFILIFNPIFFVTELFNIPPCRHFSISLPLKVFLFIQYSSASPCHNDLIPKVTWTFLISSKFNYGNARERTDGSLSFWLADGFLSGYVSSQTKNEFCVIYRGFERTVNLRVQVLILQLRGMRKHIPMYLLQK